MLKLLLKNSASILTHDIWYVIGPFQATVKDFLFSATVTFLRRETNRHLQFRQFKGRQMLTKKDYQLPARLALAAITVLAAGELQAQGNRDPLLLTATNGSTTKICGVD